LSERVDGHPEQYVLAHRFEAPHDCDVPDCPGPEVKRKVEAYEGLVEALRRILYHADAQLGGHVRAEAVAALRLAEGWEE
jgi:hypothetical protein